MLAKDAVIARGRGNLRWRAYIDASRAMPFIHGALFAAAPLPPSVLHGFEAANSVEIAERRRRLGESVELLPMIQTARDNASRRRAGDAGAKNGRGGGGSKSQGADRDEKLKKKDLRENVFAMITIATPSGRIQFHDAGPQPLPTIDYTKSTRQVFAEAARYTILERQDLLLWYNERPPCDSRLKRRSASQGTASDNQQQQRFPSWVPDFSAVPHKHTLLTPTGGMRTWWDGLPAPLRRITASLETGTLRVRARPLDRVARVSPVLDAANYRRVVLSEFEKLGPLPPSPPGGGGSGAAEETVEQRNERFWRTLVLNAGAGYGATLRDNSAADAGAVGAGFRSLVAEETILRALGCPSVAELQTPANAARLRASPALMALVPLCGRAEPFADLVVRHAAGRRFFRTEGGRFGMSAIEDVRCVEGGLYLDGDEYWDDEEEEEQKEEGVKGDRAEQTSTASTSSDSGAAGGNSSSSSSQASPASGMGHLMADPMARALMEGFQQHLQGRDPRLAQLTSQLMRGEVPGANGEEQERRRQEEDRRRGGIREGDLVVACVGGFFPYVLRPLSTGGGEGTTTTSADGSSVVSSPLMSRPDSTYEYVGDCYLHGAMEGEDFWAPPEIGTRSFRVDTAQLVEIDIV